MHFRESMPMRRDGTAEDDSEGPEAMQVDGGTPDKKEGKEKRKKAKAEKKRQKKEKKERKEKRCGYVSCSIQQYPEIAVSSAT